MSEIDYLQLAKDRISEVDGDHEIAWVNCKLNVAIADAFVALVEELRKSNHATPNHCRHEIVRCMDCRHYDPNDEPSEVYPDRYWCDKLTFYMPTDGFCSFGKPKEGGE